MYRREVTRWTLLPVNIEQSCLLVRGKYFPVGWKHVGRDQRAYCPNIYTDGVNSLEWGDGVLTVTRESGG